MSENKLTRGWNQFIRNNENSTENQQNQESWLFEKIIKIEKQLAKLTKMQRDSIQINRIKNGKGNITTDTEEIQRINRSFFKSMYSTKLENLNGMNNCLDRLPLNQNQVN